VCEQLNIINNSESKFLYGKKHGLNRRLLWQDSISSESTKEYGPEESSTHNTWWTHT